MLCDAILCYVILFPNWSGETSCHDAVKKVVALDSTKFQQLCRNILCWSQCCYVSKQVTQLVYNFHYPKLSTISCTALYPILFSAAISLYTLILCDELIDFYFVLLVAAVGGWPIWGWLVVCIPIFKMLYPESDTARFYAAPLHAWFSTALISEAGISSLTKNSTTAHCQNTSFQAIFSK